VSGAGGSVSISVGFLVRILCGFCRVLGENSV
jgi:hypothetical protein